MAQKDWPAGVIRKTPVVPEGSFQESKAPGVWSLEQVDYWKKQGQWPIAGNEMASAFIENLFQTWLYTGTGSAQTITNGIDLAGKGGLVWMKKRSSSSYGGHLLVDTANGTGTSLSTNITNGSDGLTGFTSFNADGFSMSGACYTYLYNANENGSTYASWTFRKQPKFFDVVTWTGTGTTTQTINHSLGDVPGVIMMKRTDGAGGDWYVYHRSLGATQYIVLNTTAAAQSIGVDRWFPTATTFGANSYFGANVNGATYVAYLFAHNAGGFGLSGTENVISCGSYTGNGSTAGPVVNLGWEPQWLLIKSSSNGTQNWAIHDNMRGLSDSTGVELRPNTSDPEFTSTSRLIKVLATGFQPAAADDAINQSGGTYIYIAIRRGPMKVPTDGTKVFSSIAYTGNGTSLTLGGLSFAPDYVHTKSLTGYGASYLADRLRGSFMRLQTETTSEEINRYPGGIKSFNMDGFSVGQYSDVNPNGQGQIAWNFRRAPGFFDVVCYTGAGSPQVVNHNLGVVPEFAILRDRTIGGDWRVYSATLGVSKLLNLQTTGAAGTVVNYWGDGSTITATQFNVSPVSNSGSACVGYLFASCPGVSKVGSYTGTGTTQQIDCGFTGGARFVLIKRTDSTGDWYVWDSARGIVAGNDPYLLLNSTAAEVTTTDYIDTYAQGFEISSTAPAAINASGGTFIYLAIA